VWQGVDELCGEGGEATVGRFREGTECSNEAGWRAEEEDVGTFGCVVGG